MATARMYQSPLREAQAALTRERIFMAAMDYLEKHDIETLTLRHVAELSGVSPPTVYAHFPTMEDLVSAFFQWIKPRLALDQPLPPFAELTSLPSQLFPRYEAHGTLLRNLMNRPSWDRQRINDRERRHGAWIEAIGAALPGLTLAQRRRGASGDRGLLDADVVALAGRHVWLHARRGGARRRCLGHRRSCRRVETRSCRAGATSTPINQAQAEDNYHEPRRSHCRRRAERLVACHYIAAVRCPLRIIDRSPRPSTVSKALAVWSGSLEALQGMQVIDAFLAAGKRLRALSVGDSNRNWRYWRWGDGIDSPYPYPSSCRRISNRADPSQPPLRAWRRDRALRRTVGLPQNDGGVTARPEPRRQRD